MLVYQRVSKIMAPEFFCPEDYRKGIPMAVRGPGSRTSVCLAVCIPANLAVAIGWMLFITVKWHQGCFLHASSHKITPVARNLGFCTHFAVRICQVYVFIFKMDRKHFAKNRGQNARTLWTPKKRPKTANHFEGQSLVSMKVVWAAPDIKSVKSNPFINYSNPPKK